MHDWTQFWNLSYEIVINYLVYRQEVEELGQKLNFSASLNNFHNVSLGQGQEVVAEEALDIAAKNGHWVVLQVSLVLSTREL